MIKYILILSMILTQNAYADDASAAAATVLLVFGAARTSQYNYQRGVWPDELQDWKDPKTQVTAEIVEQCGLLMEGRLLGTNRHNMLMLITKTLDTDIKLKPQDIEFEFESGLVRRGSVDLSTEYNIKKDTRYVIMIPFPRKDDFKNQNNINVSIPFKTDKKECSAKLKFLRSSEVPPLLTTYTRMTSFEFEFAYGNGNTNGDLKTYSPSGVSLYRFDLNFMGPRHGSYFGFAGSSNSSISTSLASSHGLTSTQPESYISFMTLGYLNRTIISQQSMLTFKIGLDWARLTIEDHSQKSNRVNFSTLGYHTQVMYSYTFAQVDYGAWRGDYAIGFGLDAHLIPAAKTNTSSEYSGSQYGGIVSIKMGY